MKFGVLGIVGLILLTGCASSPSLDSQLKLIHYQACLERQENIQQSLRDLFVKSGTYQSVLSSFLKMGLPDPKTGLIKNLEATIEACEKYRP